MAAWPVTSIREQYPEAHITWAVQQTPAPIIDDVRLVNQVSIFSRERWRKARGSPATWREQLRAYLQFRRQKIDVAIDLHGHSKTALLLRLSGARARISVPGTDTLARTLNPQTKVLPKSNHAVDAFFAALEEVGITRRALKPILPDTVSQQTALRSKLPSSKPIATIQTGASRAERLYPIAKWNAVAAELVQHGYHVVGIGGPGDPQLDGGFASDWVGKLDLRECIAAVAISDVHLAGDTGTGHMAAALGVPVVSIFGMDAPRMERYRPWTDLRVQLRLGGDPALVEPTTVVQAALEFSTRNAQTISH